MKLIITKHLISCKDGNAVVADREMGILIDGEMILKVEALELLEEERKTLGIEIIDAGDGYVLPGLIDAHLHLSFSASSQPLCELKQDNQDQTMLRMVGAAQTELKSGVTTVRDSGAKGMSILSLRDMIRKEILVGPDIVSAGMPLTITGGHCYFCGLEADSQAEVIKAVRWLCKKGTDYIKVMVSGGNMTPGSNSLVNQYHEDILKAIVYEAHERGKKVSGHVHSIVGMEGAVRAGFDTLEHCSFQMPEGMIVKAELIEAMKKARTMVCPAMGKAYILPPEEAAPLPEKVSMWGEFQQNRFTSTQAMYDAGIPIVAGTDAGCKNTKFDELYLTLHMMEEKIHMTKEDVLLSATADAAKAIGMEESVGTIEPGKQADIIITCKNPLETMMNLKSPSVVVKRGKKVGI